MKTVWTVIYWGNFVTGTIFNTFLQRYWRTGHFRWFMKVITAFRNLLIILIILGVLAGAGMLALYLWKKEEGLAQAMSVLMILGNCYGLLVLVLLLGYGLFHIPIKVWWSASRSFTFYHKVGQAHPTFQKYRESLIELYNVIAKCNGVIEKGRKQEAKKDEENVALLSQFDRL